MSLGFAIGALVVLFALSLPPISDSLLLDVQRSGAFSSAYEAGRLPSSLEAVASAPVACGGTNPPLAFTVLHAGDGPAIIGLHDTPGDDTEASQTLATRDEIGAVYGLAWDNARSALYASAYHKRGVPFGPGGPGAIYRIEPGTGASSLFATVSAGEDRHDARDEDDEGAADWVARSSLGDLEIDDKATQLFVANLYDARIHRIALPGGEPLGDFAHGARDETWLRRARLFGLGWHDGWLYHGVMDTQEVESGPDPLVPPGRPDRRLLGETSAEKDGPVAHIYRSRSDGSEMHEVFSTRLGLSNSIWGFSWLKQFPMIVDIEILEDGRAVLGFRNRRVDQDAASTGFRDSSLLPIGAIQVRAPDGSVIDGNDPTAGGSLARIPGLAIAAMPMLRSSADPYSGLPVGNAVIQVEWRTLDRISPIYREVISPRDGMWFPAPGDIEVLCAPSVGLSPDLALTVTAAATAGAEATADAGATLGAATETALVPTLTALATVAGPTQTADAATATALSRIPPERRTNNVIEQGCQTEHTMYAITCYVYGATDAITGRAARAPAIVAFSNSGKIIELVEYAAVGTVYGLGHDRSRGHLYAGAWYTRNGLVGPSGGGALYRIDLETGRTTTWQRLAAGPTIHPSMTKLDTSSASWAGRIGLGDVEVSEDATQLFVVNLFNRRIHRFSLPDGAPLPSLAIGSGAEPWSPSARPMGLAFRDGWLYHGVVNSGEQGIGPFEAVVYRSRADGSAMKDVARLDLNIRISRTQRWWPWTGSGLSSNPQPMLSDIEMTDDGDMVLGIHDRRSDAYFGLIGTGEILLMRRTSDSPDDAPRFELARNHFRKITSVWGALASDPFDEQVVTSAYGPILPRTSGALWYHETTGTVRFRKTIARTAQRFVTGGLPISRKMPQGLGDIETLCAAPVEPTPTPTRTPTDTPTATNTPTHTPTSTPTPTPTFTPTPTPTTVPQPIYLPRALKNLCIPRVGGADVVLVLDLSTSMHRETREGRTKMEAAVSAAGDFVSRLDLRGTEDETGDEGGDRAAIVGFNASGWIEVGLTADRAALKRGLDRLPDRSVPGTRLDSAFSTATHAMTLGARGGDALPVIILLTDGLPSGVPTPEAGGTQEETVLAAASAAKATGARVFTIGLGLSDDVLDALLREAATRPADFYFAPDGEDLAGIYREIAGRLIGCP